MQVQWAVKPIGPVTDCHQGPWFKVSPLATKMQKHWLIQNIIVHFLSDHCSGIWSGLWIHSCVEFVMGQLWFESSSSQSVTRFWFPIRAWFATWFLLFLFQIGELNLCIWLQLWNFPWVSWVLSVVWSHMRRIKTSSQFQSDPKYIEEFNPSKLMLFSVQANFIHLSLL